MRSIAEGCGGVTGRGLMDSSSLTGDDQFA